MLQPKSTSRLLRDPSLGCSSVFPFSQSWGAVRPRLRGTLSGHVHYDSIFDDDPDTVLLLARTHHVRAPFCSALEM